MKIKKIIFLKLNLSVFLIILSSTYINPFIKNSFAAPQYFVTESGGVEGGDGTQTNPFSVSSFNNLTGDYSGATFYFSGIINSQISPKIFGTFNNPLILDGYKDGDCRTCDGEWPENCKTNATLIDRKNGEYAIVLKEQNKHTIIQDFEITNMKVGVSGWNTPEYITVRRSYIHNSVAQNGSRAVFFTYTLGVGNNVTIGGERCNGIIAKDIGIDTGCADIGISGSSSKRFSDVIVSYNHLYATRTDRGIDGIHFIKVSNFLIEFNKIHSHNDHTSSGGLGENAMDIKGGSHDGIIRFNEVYNELIEPSIIIQTADGGGNDTYNIYVYGNRIRDNTSGILAAYPRYINGIPQGKVYNIFIWSNIIVNNRNEGISIIRDDSRDFGYDNIHIINNTIIGNTFPHKDIKGNDVPIYTSKNGIKQTSILPDATIYLKNNILSNNRPDRSDGRQAYLKNITQIVLDSNHYYHSEAEAKIHTGENDENPLKYDLKGEISNPKINTNFIPFSNSPVLKSGVNLSGQIGIVTVYNKNYELKWEIALNPESDFTKVLNGNSAIKTLERSKTGKWDKGAFSFSNNFLAPPSGLAIVQ